MRLAILVTMIVASLVLLPSGSARPADVDVSVRVSLGTFGPGGVGPTNETRTERRNFIIVVSVDTLSPVLQDVTVTIGLPDGLRWGADDPDPSEGCTGTAPAVCKGRLEPGSQVGTIGAGWHWDVVADRNGTYEISASVEPTERDPDTANNRTTFRFGVASPSSGGGGGSGVSATASAARVTPAKPKAGVVVAATVRVSAGGAPVQPTRVACTGSIGAAKVKGTPRAASGTATCRYRTPASAKGKTLRGAVSFTARGQRFTKRFAARLG